MNKNKNWTNLQCSAWRIYRIISRSFFSFTISCLDVIENSFLYQRVVEEAFSFRGEKRRRLVLVFVHHHSLLFFLSFLVQPLKQSFHRGNFYFFFTSLLVALLHFLVFCNFLFFQHTQLFLLSWFFFIHFKLFFCLLASFTNFFLIFNNN